MALAVLLSHSVTIIQCVPLLGTQPPDVVVNCSCFLPCFLPYMYYAVYDRYKKKSAPHISVSLTCDADFLKGYITLMYVFLFVFYALCYSSIYCFIDAAEDTKEQYACYADEKCQTCVAVALECRQRIVALLNVHSLDNEQVVVE